MAVPPWSGGPNSAGASTASLVNRSRRHRPSGCARWAKLTSPSSWRCCATWLGCSTIQPAWPATPVRCGGPHVPPGQGAAAVGHAQTHAQGDTIMIARIATFPTLPPDVSAEVHRNVLDRFMPALRAQDGFVAGYWLAYSAGSWCSFQDWEMEQTTHRGADVALTSHQRPSQ